MDAQEIRAVGKYLRIAPAKVRAILGQVKGKHAEEAVNLLTLAPQKSARLILKVLKSAIANADQEAKLDVDKLVVKNVYVDGGPTLKRFRARAMGRAARILKRTCHITVILKES
jgi:large subunit ribosomal protein L22